MTAAVPISFEDAMTVAARHREVQMWRAAQTVAAHLALHQGRQEVLDCLGLTNPVRPADL